VLLCAGGVVGVGVLVAGGGAGICCMMVTGGGVGFETSDMHSRRPVTPTRLERIRRMAPRSATVRPRGIEPMIALFSAGMGVASIMAPAAYRRRPT